MQSAIRGRVVLASNWDWNSASEVCKMQNTARGGAVFVTLETCGEGRAQTDVGMRLGLFSKALGRMQGDLRL